MDLESETEAGAGSRLACCGVPQYYRKGKDWEKMKQPVKHLTLFPEILFPKSPFPVFRSQELNPVKRQNCERSMKVQMEEKKNILTYEGLKKCNTPTWVSTLTISSTFAPSKAFPTGDSLEIFPFGLLASVEPTILYSNSSLYSKSKIFTLQPILILSKSIGQMWNGNRKEEC